MADSRTYRHTVTGATRQSTRALGHPWAEAEEASVSSMTKDELISKAESLGLDTSGTKAELQERIEAASK